MYENHNHAYDEIRQVHHDQNREKETIKKQFFENEFLMNLSRT